MNLLEMQIPERFVQEASFYEDLVLGRVSSQARDLYQVVTDQGELLAEVAGKLRYQAYDASDYPAVGDYVMLDRPDDTNGNAMIQQVLRRQSSFLRKAAGSSQDSQVVAANIDLVFLCMALNKDFNLRRLERYLAIAWESGATPVVALTKADLCQDLAVKLQQVESVALGADLLVTSSLAGEGLAEISRYLQRGKTAAFIGSSGVGKSTLINCLMGQAVLATAAIRQGDDKGRHTTTRRELLLLPSGGVVIDTPGMRELGLDRADLGQTFSEIETLAQGCKFRDCQHQTEPGCAVLAAVERGELQPERLASYQKLKKEAGYEGLNSRQIEEQKVVSMFGGKGEMKQFRDAVRHKKRNR